MESGAYLGNDSLPVLEKRRAETATTLPPTLRCVGGAFVGRRCSRYASGFNAGGQRRRGQEYPVTLPGAPISRTV